MASALRDFRSLFPQRLRMGLGDSYGQAGFNGTHCFSSAGTDIAPKANFLAIQACFFGIAAAACWPSKGEIRKVRLRKGER